MANKALSTQKLANAYPLWSDIREDEQSVGFQFLNSIGNRFDDLRKQLERINANYYLPSAIVSDIDVYYRFKLPRSYTFASPDGDDTELSFTAPTVSGVLSDGSFVSISLAEDNNIENFWYNAIPSRVSIASTEVGVINGHLVASGFVNTRLIPLVASGILEHTNKLIITISGIDSCISFTDNKPSIGTVQVEGITRAGLLGVEELYFLHNDVQSTIREYTEVSGIHSYGFSPDTAMILCTSFKKTHDREDKYQKSAYVLGTTIDQYQMPLFWTTTSGIAVTHPTQHLLELHKYDIDDPELRLDGHTSKSVLQRFELINISGLHFAPNNFVIEEWSKNIWMVDDHNLYLFDDELYYPNTSLLNKKDYDAPAVIVPSETVLVSGMEVSLEYIWRRPTIGLVRHRIWVEKPDGSKYSLEAGVEAPYHTDASSWVYGEPHSRYIKPVDTFTLDQRGDYIFSLETYYTDETSYIDQRIVSTITKTPRAQFFLPAISLYNKIIAIDIDSEGKLWIFDENNNRYEIQRHYDTMLIDLEKKILYFREAYSQVRVLQNN